MNAESGARKSICGNSDNIQDSIAYSACLPRFTLGAGRYTVSRMEIAVLLHNVRSAHNVGSIFRTCDAAGVSRVYLTGYTPAPTDRFGRAQKDIAKTALGAEHNVPWEYRKSPTAVIARLNKTRWRIVGVEQSRGQFHIWNCPPKTSHCTFSETKCGGFQKAS